MTSETHAMCGILSTYIVSKAIGYTNTDEILTLCIGGFIGGILPDIDMPNSMICKLLPVVDKVWHKTREVLNCFNDGTLFRAIGRSMGHRGITHTVFFCMLPYFFLLIHPLLVGGMIIGCFSHLLADIPSKKPIRPFYPFKFPFKKKFKKQTGNNKKKVEYKHLSIGLNLIDTGSKSEIVFYYIVLITGLYIIYKHQVDNFCSWIITFLK